MDILIENGKAHYLYPDGAPELHPDIVIVKNYVGEVAEGWDWDGSTFSEPVDLKYDRIFAETFAWPNPNAEQLAYIRALASLKDQEGWPDSVTWPEKPE